MSNRFRRNAGVTLVELIVALVIMGVALAGMVAVYTATTRSSTDPVIVQQMQAIADNMMEEILMKPFAVTPGPGPRINFNDVRDYDKYDSGTQGVTDVEGNVIAGLERYRVQVTVVTSGGLPNVPAADALLVTVTVTDMRQDPNDPNAKITLTGWRTNPS
jgi:MSHA pilin protein MshD